MRDLELLDTCVRAKAELVAGWLESSDVAFLSITKSGRTWVRFFLQEYFGHLCGTSFDLRPRVMPASHSSPSICFTADFFDLYATKDVTPFIVFKAEMRTRKLILLVRDPRDVVISYFHWTRSRTPVEFSQHVPSGMIEEFVRSQVFGLERISQMHLAEMEFYDEHPGPKFLIKYEDLWFHKGEMFGQLLQFLGETPINKNAFDQALDRAEFSEMQKLEISISKAGKARDYLRLGVENWSGDINALKVRRGGVEGFRESLPELADPVHLNAKFPSTRRVLTSSGGGQERPAERSLPCTRFG